MKSLKLGAEAVRTQLHQNIPQYKVDAIRCEREATVHDEVGVEAES